MKRRKPKPLAEQLRAALRAAERAGTTRYRLSQISGLQQSQLQRIGEGQEPRLGTAERLAAALGKRLVLVDDDG